MPRTAAVLALFSVFPLVGLAAQGRALAQGDRVRVTMRYDAGTVHPVGSVVRRANDTLFLRLATGGAPLPIPESTIETVEVSGGRHTKAGQGALIGLAVGSLGGAVLGGISACDDWCTPAQGALALGVIMGGLGAGLGALVGSMDTRERWHPVSWSHERVTLGLHGNGVALTIAF
jgi:hypothetical protein